MSIFKHFLAPGILGQKCPSIPPYTLGLTLICRPGANFIKALTQAFYAGVKCLKTIFFAIKTPHFC